MRPVLFLATALLLFSMASSAFGFTMSVQPARISGQTEKVDFVFDFNGLKDGNYEIRIAVPECSLDQNASCALNYSAIISKDPANGTCGYYPKTRSVNCKGNISGATAATISFTAMNSAENGKPRQRASEKWSAEVKNSGKTEGFSQTIFLEWLEQDGQEAQGTGGQDSNAPSAQGTGKKTGESAGAKNQKQRAWALSAKDFVLAIEAVLGITLIVYAIGSLKKGGLARRWHTRRRAVKHRGRKAK